MNADFPRILSLLRKERHISQKDAAADLGITQALLSHYEKGKRECGLEFLVKAADYYNVSADYLLGRSPVPTGNVIVESDIPDSALQDKNPYGASNLSLSLARKLFVNSIDVICGLLAKIGNAKLTAAVTNAVTFTIYKIFRIIFRSSKGNSQTMFEISDDRSCYMADAGIHISEADAVSAINETEQEAPEISTVTIENEYPKQAPALLSLIKQSETMLKKL